MRSGGTTHNILDHNLRRDPRNTSCEFYRNRGTQTGGDGISALIVEFFMNGK